MGQWSSGPRPRIVKINGVWIRDSAVSAVAPTVAGKARIHLTHGTVDVPLRDGQTVDYGADCLWPKETP